MAYIRRECIMEEAKRMPTISVTLNIQVLFDKPFLPLKPQTNPIPLTFGVHSNRLSPLSAGVWTCLRGSASASRSILGREVPSKVGRICQSAARQNVLQVKEHWVFVECSVCNPCFRICTRYRVAGPRQKAHDPIETVEFGSYIELDSRLISRLNNRISLIKCARNYMYV